MCVCLLLMFVSLPSSPSWLKSKVCVFACECCFVFPSSAMNNKCPNKLARLHHVMSMNKRMIKLKLSFRRERERERESEREKKVCCYCWVVIWYIDMIWYFDVELVYLWLYVPLETVDLLRYWWYWWWW